MDDPTAELRFPREVLRQMDRIAVARKFRESDDILIFDIRRLRRDPSTENDVRKAIERATVSATRIEIVLSELVVAEEQDRVGGGSALMRHLANLGRESGLHEFIAEVLPENVPMLNVFERSGLAMSTKRDGTVMHVTLRFASAEIETPSPPAWCGEKSRGWGSAD